MHFQVSTAASCVRMTDLTTTHPAVSSRCPMAPGSIPVQRAARLLGFPVSAMDDTAAVGELPAGESVRSR